MWCAVSLIHGKRLPKCGRAFKMVPCSQFIWYHFMFEKSSKNQLCHLGDQVNLDCAFVTVYYFNSGNQSIYCAVQSVTHTTMKNTPNNPPTSKIHPEQSMPDALLASLAKMNGLFPLSPPLSLSLSLSLPLSLTVTLTRYSSALPAGPRPVQRENHHEANRERAKEHVERREECSPRQRNYAVLLQYNENLKTERENSEIRHRETQTKEINRSTQSVLTEENKRSRRSQHYGMKTITLKERKPY